MPSKYKIDVDDGIRGKNVEGLAEVGGVRWRERRGGAGDGSENFGFGTLVLERLRWIISVVSAPLPTDSFTAPTLTIRPPS
jgi:hypothetical protein